MIEIKVALCDTKQIHIISGEDDTIELHERYFRLRGSIVQEEEKEKPHDDEDNEEWKKALVEKKTVKYDYDIVYHKENISAINFSWRYASEIYEVEVICNAGQATNIHYSKKDREKALSVHRQLLEWRFS